MSRERLMTGTIEPHPAAARPGTRTWPRAVLCAALLLGWLVRPAHGADIPPWLPRYDLAIDLRVDEHQVIVRERVTWTNPGTQPTAQVVFNVASHYAVPDKDVGFLAKMLEI